MRGTWALGAADFSLGTVILIALVATIGALLIHNLSRRRRPVHREESQVGAGTVQGHATVPEVRSAMQNAARRMGLPEHLLPAVALPNSSEGDFVYREGDTYVYCTYERATRIAEHRTADLDDLLYHVFRDRAWTRSYMALVGQDLTPEDHAARLAEGQLSLLERADPRWAARLRGEGS